MTKLKFATEAYKRVRSFTPEQILRNWVVEKDDSDSEDVQIMLIQRPGYETFSSLPSSIQALYTADGAMAGNYAVANSNLYSFTEGASALIGAMSGDDANCVITANFDRLAIQSGPLFYLYGASTGSLTNTFRNVVIPDGYLVADITSINGYFIAAMTDGTWFWLVPGTDAFDALNFATAESLPDGLVGVETLNGNLFFFGTRSIEVWQPNGNLNLPFQRTTGQDYQRGCLNRDTIQHFDNSLLWVGDDAKVYRASMVPEKISTDGVDERLKLRTGDPSAFTFSYDGHLFYVLRIPGQGSFAYDIASKLWSEFETDGAGYWKPHNGIATLTIGTLCGDSDSGAIWKLTDASTDAGTLMRRTVSGTAAIESKPVRVDNIVIDVGSGAACNWNLRWCDADEDISAQPWISLAARSGADSLSLYRLGQALSPYRQFEVEITDNVSARFSGARVGEAWK
jgi:hypothetical protein